MAELVRLCELAGVAVIESAPMHLNFPDDHPLHLGYQWNTPEQNPLLADADVILVLGSDVPWIPGHNRPDRSARIYVVDVDPLKTQIQLWYLAASRYAMADLGTAVRQIAGRLTERGRLDPAAVQARAERVRATHDAQRARWAAREQPGADGTITPEYLVACVRDCIGPDAIVLNEAISNYPAVSQHLRASRPGSVLGIGGGSLGWSGGAAVGMVASTACHVSTSWGRCTGTGRIWAWFLVVGPAGHGLAHLGQLPRDRRAAGDGRRRRLLDDRPVQHGVGERQADLDRIGARFDHRHQQIGPVVPDPAGDVADQYGPALVPDPAQGGLNRAHG